MQKAATVIVQSILPHVGNKGNLNYMPFFNTNGLINRFSVCGTICRDCRQFLVRRSVCWLDCPDYSKLPNHWVWLRSCTPRELTTI